MLQVRGGNGGGYSRSTIRQWGKQKVAEHGTEDRRSLTTDICSIGRARHLNLFAELARVKMVRYIFRGPLICTLVLPSSIVEERKQTDRDSLVVSFMCC